jgi:tripartite-type tricarboxylate transporter receptor subunit TctC
MSALARARRMGATAQVTAALNDIQRSRREGEESMSTRAHNGPDPVAHSRRELLLAAAAATTAALMPATLDAQERFPSRTIRIIVPFPAGATTDMLARLFAQRMGETMGQSVVVENVGGGGGSIGADQVAKAQPDGHTLLFGNITFTTTTSSLLYAGKARHGFDDFVPVSVGAYVPLLLLAHPSVPAKDLKEFVAYAKASPTPVFYGSTGPGSILHLMAEVLKRDAGIKMDHVPFRGAAPLVTELLSGRIQFGGDQLSSSLARVRGGQLTALAVATKSVALPNVPTVRELGYPNLELQGWNGFLAPKNTPAAVVARLQQEIAAAARHPDVVKRMTEVGAEPSGSTQAEMRAMLDKQIAQVRPAVEELKLVVQ